MTTDRSDIGDRVASPNNAAEYALTHGHANDIAQEALRLAHEVFATEAELIRHVTARERARNALSNTEVRIIRSCVNGKNEHERKLQLQEALHDDEDARYQRELIEDLDEKISELKRQIDYARRQHHVYLALIGVRA